ncbi:acyl-CoA thioesterase domain-containing protein [Acinetobacter radioresistens]|uniref:acyl-CoA thioesterase domain-containing protein n=1 Tax=Acinetobacter radioresistens TaxID=40216 RepID=UPI0009466F2C|nr:acyl-CoA thioesterase domain-containing protein [Acinetobacter radioresistens]
MINSKTLTDSLLELLTLELISENTYRGISKNLVGERVFGGQIIAQALIAASNNVFLPAASLHCYFYLPGTVKSSIDYYVSELVNLPNISIRQVDALQYDRKIFQGIFRFSPFAENLKSNVVIPQYPNVENLRDEDFYKRFYYKKYPEKFPKYLLDPFLVLSKPITLVDPIFPCIKNNKYAEYFRTHDELRAEPQIIHQAITAFYSDYNLLSSALSTHALSFYEDKLRVASLDHTMHFHSPILADKWILYDICTTTTAGHRGLNIGHMWQFDNLICTTSQESLIKIKQ